LQPRYGSRPAPRREAPLELALVARPAAREIEPGQLADHRVAADADVGSDLAAGEAGLEVLLQKLNSFVGPSR